MPSTIRGAIPSSPSLENDANRHETPPTQTAGKVASSGGDGGNELSTSSSAILLTTLRAVAATAVADGGTGTSLVQAVPTTEGTVTRTVPSSIVLDPSTPVLILTEAEVAGCPPLVQRQPGEGATTGTGVATRNARDITSSSVMTGM
uniref:Uncharacterized protein n=1 Tax=Anopheles farauti TaxID=69004 RepID=A0A182QBE7_9DIPT